MAFLPWLNRLSPPNLGGNSERIVGSAFAALQRRPAAAGATNAMADPAIVFGAPSEHPEAAYSVPRRQRSSMRESKV